MKKPKLFIRIADSDPYWADCQLLDEEGRWWLLADSMSLRWIEDTTHFTQATHNKKIAYFQHHPDFVEVPLP